jgi:hypothetical protein
MIPYFFNIEKKSAPFILKYIHADGLILIFPIVKWFLEALAWQTNEYEF